MWNVTLFYNTGLNTMNVLDSPEKLSNVGSVDVPALDILQGEGLSYVSVRAKRAQVKNADYMRLTDTESGDVFYYAVNSFNATSVDVQRLNITLDALMTLAHHTRGIHNIKFLDGVVERHHVSSTQDVYGAYTEHDPLMVPSKELVFDEEHLFMDTSGNYTRILECTGKINKATNEAVTFEDKKTKGKCTAPVPIPALESGDGTKVAFGANKSNYDTLSTAYYDRDDKAVNEGLKIARGLGIEGGTILNSVRIPSSMITVTKNNGHINVIVGKNEEQASKIRFEYANVHNKRVLYGQLNTIELISVASGVRMSFKPEDLYDGSGGSLSVIQSVDPRVDGRPYYRFKFYKGKSANLHEFFQNAVAGMEWANEPLIYTGQSGSTLTEMRYNTSMDIANMNYSNDRKGIAADQFIDHVNTWSGMAGDMFGAGMNGGMPNPIKALQSGLSHLSDVVALTGRDTMRDFAKGRLEDEYKANANRELQEMKIATTIQAPDLHFPRSTSIRDYLGNGVYVLRYKPQESDIIKLDKILTMYGYKDTKALEGTDFSNRSKFNFVKASGVSIGGKLPRWLREAAAAQLGAGCRVWHQLPDVSAYTDGSNK